MLPLLQPCQHRIEVLLGDVGGDAAQHVVGAELQDDQSGAVGNRPVEPRQAAARRVAGHAGVDHLDVVAPGFERGLQLFGKGFARIEPVSGHKAVAEADDAIRARQSPQTRQQQEACRQQKRRARV